MDPNMTLHELRELCGEALAESGNKRADLVDEIAERFDALDQWLSRGGFVPSAWAHPEAEDHR